MPKSWLTSFFWPKISIIFLDKFIISRFHFSWTQIIANFKMLAFTESSNRVFFLCPSLDRLEGMIRTFEECLYTFSASHLGTKCRITYIYLYVMILQWLFNIFSRLMFLISNKNISQKHTFFQCKAMSICTGRASC